MSNLAVPSIARRGLYRGEFGMLYWAEALERGVPAYLAFPAFSLETFALSNGVKNCLSRVASAIREIAISPCVVGMSRGLQKDFYVPGKWRAASLLADCLLFSICKDGPCSADNLAMPVAFFGGGLHKHAKSVV